MDIVYRCKRHDAQAIVSALEEAKAFLGCASCVEAKLSRGKCYGPKMLDEATGPVKLEVKSKEKKNVPAPETIHTPANSSGTVPGVTAEIDEAIHNALADVPEEVSAVSGRRGEQSGGADVVRYGNDGGCKNVMDRDSVNHPAHYGGADNPHEAIKCIRAHLTDEEYRGFLKGNALKYLMREGKKDNAASDLGKALTYMKWLVQDKE